MGCFRTKSSKSTSTLEAAASEATFPPQYQQEIPEPRNLREETLLLLPGCTAHLMEEGEALELAKGEFKLVRISDENVSLATIVKVGDDLQWPLTKDEPVVKLDALHYLFSLPMKDGDPLSYGVTFLEQCGGSLGLLDSFLSENSCFSASASAKNRNVDWKEFAPNVEAYNNVLAKAIAGGTGHIVKGIFKCSNAYANQVHKGGEMILIRAAEEGKSGATAREISSGRSVGPARKGKVNKSLKRVRKLSKMTEKLSKAMLDGVGIATGSVMGPLVKSKAGKAFLSMVPGEIIDAAEVAEKQALSATSQATTRMISNRFGENAGEAAEDAFATAGHCASTAWNVFKIRKAINPASSVSSSKRYERHGTPDMSSKQKAPDAKTIKQEVLLQIPACRVVLVDGGEAEELAKGRFSIIRILDKNISVATVIKVGDDFQWPLTKDEPVVKLDSLHYLFSLPMKDGDTLSYGVTFLDECSSYLPSLDSFLNEHACFSSCTSTGNRNIDWKQFAPKIEDYNNVLAKAIAQGTGQIVRGIFMCSNTYSNQVLSGAEAILSPASEAKNVMIANTTHRKSSGGAEDRSLNLKRVRDLSKKTESLSKATLNGVGAATGSLMAPLVNSQAGKAFLASAPGEILDAAEVAEKQALSATSSAATRMVANRYGESAGEATGDVLATTGHCANTAWNIFKIRKAITPASSVSTGLLKNAPKQTR
ncbi:hypothetical protein Tsubulata_033655 [Turnera subulata]|uniref:Senescence domain-containing protein n=1 Tax=Turnera subulata TaxID=218843 RepID=A0A9Q0JJD9_9ROSI|nr:hypothetical protein Tsubulata_033655 [Turnera subulata]